MKKTDLIELSRRDLITRIFPACAAACILPGKIPGLFELEKNEIFQQAQHKFDKEYKLPRPVSYRQYFTQIMRANIELCKTLVKELGEEKALEIIKINTRKNSLRQGENQAKALGNNSFSAFTSIFKNPQWKNILTHKIVEDTDKAFEIKVTECLPYEIFKATDFAGKFGWACVCYGDYITAEGFNPKIKLVRDKTLMEGDTYCNHRYIWTG